MDINIFRFFTTEIHGEIFTTELHKEMFTTELRREIFFIRYPK